MEEMNDKQAAAKIEIEPVVEAGINCGFYFVVVLIAVALDRTLLNWTTLTYALVILPYLIILGFVLARRNMGRPRFSIGSVESALVRFILIWAALGLIAFMFAWNNGLFRPMSAAVVWNHITTVVEVPLAEEFVFRAALLTSLQQTPLGTRAFLGVPFSVPAGAILFSIIHCMIFASAGFSVTDTLLSSGVALISGLIFGTIYVRTENVWYGVFLHMLFNFGQWI